MDTTEVESLFRHLGDSTYLPMPVTTGPWRSTAQHGSPPAALLAHVCEHEVGADESVARFGVDLLTGVPLTPLRAIVERRTISRRVAHLHAELLDGERPVARAMAVVLVNGDVPEPDWRAKPQPRADWRGVTPVPAPHWAADSNSLVFHRDGLEHRFIEGAFDRAGPAQEWIRLRYPIVGGVEPTGLERVMASVDVGSGISAVFDPAKGFGMINADLDVAFVTPPQGEWLLLDAVSHLGPGGTGLAITRVHDEHGLVAVATQCLLGTAFNPG